MAKQSASNRRAAAQQRDAFEDWLNAQASVNTRAAYRCDLEAFGAWCARHGALPLTADTATLVAFQTARQAAGDSTWRSRACGRHAAQTTPPAAALKPSRLVLLIAAPQEAHVSSVGL